MFVGKMGQSFFHGWDQPIDIPLDIQANISWDEFGVWMLGFGGVRSWHLLSFGGVWGMSIGLHLSCCCVLVVRYLNLTKISEKRFEGSIKKNTSKNHLRGLSFPKNTLLSGSNHLTSPKRNWRFWRFKTWWDLRLLEARDARGIDGFGVFLMCQVSQLNKTPPLRNMGLIWFNKALLGETMG